LLIPFKLLASFPSSRDCAAIAIMAEDVMLNLFQHLIESILYETLK